VWREIMFVVFKHEQVEGRNQPVSHVAGDQVNLMVLKRASEQAEIHDARRRGEMQAVGRDQALVAVGTLHEFVSEARPPLRSVRSGLRNRLQMQAAGIVAPNFNGKSVVESKWRPQRQMKTFLVFRVHALINGLAV